MLSLRRLTNNPYIENVFNFISLIIRNKIGIEVLLAYKNLHLQNKQ